MKETILNVLLAVDIFLNKRMYIRQMQRNGFFTVGPRTTRRELYMFFRKEP